MKNLQLKIFFVFTIFNSMIINTTNIKYQSSEALTDELTTLSGLIKKHELETGKISFYNFDCLNFNGIESLTQFIKKQKENNSNIETCYVEIFYPEKKISRYDVYFINKHQYSNNDMAKLILEDLQTITATLDASWKYAFDEDPVACSATVKENQDLIICSELNKILAYQYSLLENSDNNSSTSEHSIPFGMQEHKNSFINMLPDCSNQFDKRISGTSIAEKIDRKIILHSNSTLIKVVLKKD